MDIIISRPTTKKILEKMKKNPFNYFNKITVKNDELKITFSDIRKIKKI